MSEPMSNRDPDDKPLSPAEVFAREAAAARAEKNLVQESAHNLQNRCPECDALGSLEDVDGEIRCVDCDASVAAKRPLGGLGG